MTEQDSDVTYDVPDAEIWYSEGATVLVNPTEGGVEIVPDPHGDYEVLTCRSVQTATGERPRLRVRLRKIGR